MMTNFSVVCGFLFLVANVVLEAIDGPSAKVVAVVVAVVAVAVAVAGAVVALVARATVASASRHLREADARICRSPTQDVGDR